MKRKRLSGQSNTFDQLAAFHEETAIFRVTTSSVANKIEK